MANLSEYIEEVKDNTSGVMQQLGGSISDVVSSMQGTQVESIATTTLLRSMGGSVEVLTYQLIQLKQERDWIDPANITLIQQYTEEINALAKVISSMGSAIKVDIQFNFPQGSLDVPIQGDDTQTEKLRTGWELFIDTVGEGVTFFSEVIDSVGEKLSELGGVAFEAAINGAGGLIEKLSEGNALSLVTASVLGTLTNAIILMKEWGELVTQVVQALTLAQQVLNLVLKLTPTNLIVAGIIAVIALIGYLIYKIDGWGEAWEHTTQTAKFLWSGMLNAFKLGWLDFSGMVMNGIDALRIGWYKFKSLMGDDSAEQEIKIIEDRIENRRQEVAETRTAMISDFAAAWESTKKAFGSFSWNEKTLEDFVKEMKSKLGMNELPKGVAVGQKVQTDIKVVPSTENNVAAASTTANGGTKHTYITINMDDLIGVVNINKAGFQESVEDMEGEVTDALLRLLGSAVNVGN